MNNRSPLHHHRIFLGLALVISAFPAVAQQGAEKPMDRAPDTDTRHPEGGDRHVKDLGAVVVTASPLGDTAAELSKPADVLAGERLDENRGATLGGTLSSIPGVQSSNFGPGVGRPILRGMEGPRVAIVSGGLSTQDVSTISQDHAPAVEPFLADQIEVLKGPATLLFGSGAIGGVVNVVDGRIPERAIEGGFSGRAEQRFDTVNEGETSMFRIDGGTNRFALHVDGVYRNNKDYDTPQGAQPNTFIDTKTGSVGGSLLGDWGFVGASASRYENDYGNPGEPGDLANGERGVYLQMRQDRYDVKGGLLSPWGEGSGLRFSLGHNDYQHIEFEGGEVGTTFNKKATEGRVEASFDLGGGWKGALGMQGSDSVFEAIGDEAFVPRTETRAIGLFGVARKSWDDLQLDLGARVDQVDAEPDAQASRAFTPVSLSLAGGWRLDEQWRMTASFDHAERAPAEQELFSDGPHLATLAYEIGDPDLNKEAANQLEFGAQYQSALVDGKFSVYYNRFNEFIYLAETGLEFELEPGKVLPIRQWTQADARFRGLEAEATVHMADNDSGRWDLHVFGDTVLASFTDGGGDVPRIAPSRLGAQLRWDLRSWRASLGAVRYNQQDRVGEGETPTDGYTLVDAHVAYHRDVGNSAWEFFVDGSNLAGQEARVHTSFLKDVVLLPDRNLSFGVRVFF